MGKVMPSSRHNMSISGMNSAAAITCTRSTRFEPVNIPLWIGKGFVRSLPSLMNHVWAVNGILGKGKAFQFNGIATGKSLVCSFPPMLTEATLIKCLYS